MKQRERSKDEIPFREMTPAQKCSYLIDYWSKPALAVIIIVVGLIMLIHSMVSSKELLLSVTTVDSGDDKSITAYVEQFAADNGIPEDQYVVGDIIVGSAANGGGSASQAGMAFYVRLQGGSEDVLIMPEAVFEEYAMSGYFLDLTDVVPQEWQDKLVSVEQRYDEIEGVQPEPIPCGIYMRDIPGIPDTPYYQDAVIAISYNPDHHDNAVAFLNSLLKK